MRPTVNCRLHFHKYYRTNGFVCICGYLYLIYSTVVLRLPYSHQIIHSLFLYELWCIHFVANIWDVCIEKYKSGMLGTHTISREKPCTKSVYTPSFVHPTAVACQQSGAENRWMKIMKHVLVAFERNVECLQLYTGGLHTTTHEYID